MVNTQKLFRAKMDISYCKIKQWLFAACQLKLAVNSYSCSRQVKAGGHRGGGSLHVMRRPSSLD